MKTNTGFTLIQLFIGIVMFMIVAVLVGSCTVGCIIVKTVGDKGVKNVASDVWNGSNTNK